MVNVEAYVASWIEINWCMLTNRPMKVEAYVASWIEITAAVNAANQASSRGLRSLVD